MLYIITDNRNILHKKYIFETIFTNFIHLDYQLIIEDAENSLFTIELEDCDTKICFTNIFFNTTDDSFLNKQTLPTQLPNSILCKQYEINSFFNDILTIFYKTEDDFLKKLDNTYYFNFDFFGTIFFYLTRFEEYLIEQKDIHNRVDLVEFYAVRNNIAHRPLVDEYILFFRSFLRKIDRKSTRLNSSHRNTSRMPSSA